MSAETRILQPGQIEPPAGEIPFLHLPDTKTVFARRAARFRRLAQGHTLGGFLDLLGRLASAQQAALDAYPTVPLPSAEALALSREHGMPPLGCHGWQRDPAWREGFSGIVARLREEDISSAARSLLEEWASIDAGRLEKQAGQLLSGDYADLDPALTPFLAAALQTYWVAMATRLGEGAFGRAASPVLCPVCGSRPVASVVHGGAETGLRYLHCSLCASEWHMVRVKCSNCESTKGIAYYELEGSNGAIKAESCDECNTYLKILHLAKDFEMEPCADDCATLALDLLMDEAGKQRSGPNLYLHPGSL